MRGGIAQLDITPGLSSCRVVASRTFRTGLQTLVTDGCRYWMVLRNRRWHDLAIEVPPERAPLWRARLSTANDHQKDSAEGSPAVPPFQRSGGTAHEDPAAAPLSALTERGRGRVKAADDEPSSPLSVSASDRAYTLPPKAGMVPPVPRATGRAQLMSGRSNTLYEAMLEVHEAWFNLLTEMCAAWRWQAGKHAFAAKRDKATEDLRAFRAEVPK